MRATQFTDTVLHHRYVDLLKYMYYSSST